MIKCINKLSDWVQQLCGNGKSMGIILYCVGEKNDMRVISGEY